MRTSQTLLIEAGNMGRPGLAAAGFSRRAATPQESERRLKAAAVKIARPTHLPFLRLGNLWPVAVMLLAGLAGAQDSRKTTIRTETRVVLVDTMVTDKKGEYIRDLTTKDFRVWQDGKEQQVTSAELQSGAAQAGKMSYMLLLFDNTTIGSAARLKQIKAALSEFVSQPNPNLAFAVALYSGGMGMVQNFTSDAGRILKAIESVPPPGALSPFAADASLTASGGSASVASTMVSVGAPATGDTDRDQPMRAFLSDIAALARSMSGIPGRKTLVLLTGGFVVPEGALNQFKAAVDACNRANVAIYPVDVRGLNANGAELASPAGGLWAGLIQRMGAAFAGWPVSALAAFQRGASPAGRGGASTLDSGMGARQALDSLAAETGGFVLRNTNDLLAALRKIAAERDGSYAVAYTPPADSKTGCHALRVQVSRSGAQVRSRSSYCFTKPANVLAGTPAERDLESRILAGRGTASPPGTSSPAGSLQAPFFYTGSNTARLNLAMELPSAGIRFEKVKGKLHAEVNVLAVAFRNGGNAAARFSDVLKLDFDQQSEADAAAAKPLHYDNQFELGPGQYNLKVAYSQIGGPAGVLEAPLSIEPYDATRFAVSALALSRGADLRPAAAGDPAIQMAMLEGRPPLFFDGYIYTPFGDNRFRSGEQVRVYVEFYDPQLLSGKTEVKLRLILANRKTGAQLVNADMGNIASHARSGTNVIPLGFAVPAPGPGAYRVEVQATGSSGSAARAIDFEVN